MGELYAGNMNPGTSKLSNFPVIYEVYEVTLSIPSRLLDIAIPEKIHGTSARVLPLLLVAPQVSCVALESP